jgi:hypothetical protein
MNKFSTIAAIAAGIALAAAPALAANTATTRISDRVGASNEEASELTGVPLTVLIGAAVLASVIVATSDTGESN